MVDVIINSEQYAVIDAELDIKANAIMQEVERTLQDDNDKIANKYFVKNVESKCVSSINPLGNDFWNSPSHRPPNEKCTSPNHHKPLDMLSATNASELKYLQAKIKILTSEVERQRNEHRRKIGELQKRDKEITTLRQDYDKQLGLNASLQQQLNKLNTTFKERKEKLQTFEAENLELRNDLQAIKKEAKIANQRASTLEVRLNRLTEECESSKAAQHTVNIKHKEECEEHRHILEQKMISVKKSEKLQKELIIAFRKQALLCSNLKKQKVYMIAGGALKELEAQFDKLLTIK